MNWQYVITVLGGTEADSGDELVECKMFVNPDSGEVHMRKSETSSLGDDIGIAFDITTPDTAGEAMLPLIKAGSTFQVRAMCSADPLGTPEAFDVYVDALVFADCMARNLPVDGEIELALLLNEHREALFLKCESPPREDSKRVKKKSRTDLSESQRQLLQWMQNRESAVTAGLRLRCPVYLRIPQTNYVFCFREGTFVPREEGQSVSVTVHGAIVGGERNSGKTRVVRELLDTSMTPVRVPCYLRPTNTTLIIVPAPLLHHWVQSLTGLRVVSVIDSRMLARTSLSDVLEADVLLTTHAFAFAHCWGRTRNRDASVKRQLRMETALSPDCVSALRLDGIFWKRIVVDELSKLTVDRWQGWVKMLRSLRCGMWWGLQGGVCSNSFTMKTVWDMVTSCGFHLDVDGCALRPFIMECFYAARMLNPSVAIAWTDRTVFVDLTEKERAVYSVLHSSGAEASTLIRVCCGEVDAINAYVQLTDSWTDTLPIGWAQLDRAFSNFQFFAEDSDASDDSDEGDEGDELAGAAATAEPAAEVAVEEVVDELEEGEVRENPPRLARMSTTLTLQNELGDEVEIPVAHMLAQEAHSRREFFTRTVMAIADGTRALQTCVVCLTGLCDTVTLCGHTYCHECIVRLFSIEAYNDMTDYVEAPCPTCRWGLEPSDIFWVMSAYPKENGSKEDALRGMLTANSAANKKTVVFGIWPAILRSMLERMVAHGLPCRSLLGSSRLCKAAVKWFGRSRSTRGATLFVPFEQAHGLKLEGVSHVVFLHPPPGSKQQKQRVEEIAMQCVRCNPPSLLSVHRLISLDTVEELIT